MLFSSSIFLFFFLPFVIIGYHLLKPEFRISFLSLVSLFFYGWGEARYLFVMLLSIAVNYIAGLLLHVSDTKIAAKKDRVRKTVLFFSVACNLGILFYFKYLNFAIANINSVFHTDFVSRSIVMPLGISFFTFQGMSYVIDLYFRKVKVQLNPIFLTFYISFFPQLIAGPIVRYIDIEWQLRERERERERENFENFTGGAKRFIAGLSKKVIIANTVGYTADQIFANPVVENTTAVAWLGIVCYTFQIFFDFSGYSDMAIGLGKMFGFDFLENFDCPYISKTVTEFWRRWHISLSTWFRDYVYIPLGGNRTGNVYVNLCIVFIVTGLWHGASFNFLVWGLWHGLFLIIERAFSLARVRKRSFVPFRYALTMLVVIVGWVFFRVEGLRDALKYIGIMFGLIRPENVGFTNGYYFNTKILCMLVIAVIASLPLSKTKLFEALRRRAAWEYVSAAAALVLFCISAAFVVASSYNPFIYFRF